MVFNCERGRPYSGVPTKSFPLIDVSRKFLAVPKVSIVSESADKSVGPDELFDGGQMRWPIRAR